MADLAEIEEPLVELGPQLHPAAMDIVGQVVDRGEPDPGRLRTGGKRSEIDIIDCPVAIAVDEVDRTAADPFDRWDVELHRADLAVHRPGAEADRTLIGPGG